MLFVKGRELAGIHSLSVSRQINRRPDERSRNQPSQKRIANHDGLEFMFRYVIFRSFKDGLRNTDKREISRVQHTFFSRFFPAGKTNGFSVSPFIRIIT